MSNQATIRRMLKEVQALYKDIHSLEEEIETLREKDALNCVLEDPYEEGDTYAPLHYDGHTLFFNVIDDEIEDRDSLKRVCEFFKKLEEKINE